MPRLFTALVLIIVSAATSLAAGKFVHIVEKNGRSWFQGPDGKPFISVGVTSVEPKGWKIRSTSVAPYEIATKAKYETVDKWRETAASRLVSWGFNTLGAWSDAEVSKHAPKNRPLYYTVILDFIGTADGHPDAAMSWMLGSFPDVFSDGFAAHCDRIAKAKCLPVKDDAKVLGYFLDNEIRWRADKRQNEELLITFLRSRPNSPGRKAAVELLRESYGDSIDAFNDAWGRQYKSWEELMTTTLGGNPLLEATRFRKDSNSPELDAKIQRMWEDCRAFQRQVAERYFAVTTAAIRASDPNHLILGLRCAQFPGKEVLNAMTGKCDALTLSVYGLGPDNALAEYSQSPLPIVIGEFSARAKDSGLPNTRGAGVLFQTQEERGQYYQRFVEAALKTPKIIGIHWFRWVDEPAEGRFDGENSNYGVVNIQDEPYEPLVSAMRKSNSALPGASGASPKNSPKKR